MRDPQHGDSRAPPVSSIGNQAHGKSGIENVGKLDPPSGSMGSPRAMARRCCDGAGIAQTSFAESADTTRRAAVPLLVVETGVNWTSLGDLSGRRSLSV